MISLCSDSKQILSSLGKMDSCEYILRYIGLYLKSYGTEFGFLDFYLQTDVEKQIVTAVILRYNTQLYVSMSNYADFCELSDFISGFEESELICDKALSSYFPFADICFVMSKYGDNSKTSNNLCLLECTAKEVTDLVGEDMSINEKTDYFLNLAQQMRHNTVRTLGYYVDQSLVSVAVTTVNSDNTHIITTVFTDKYFRGNGYAQKTLDSLCVNTFAKYSLLCEKHNVEFYKKCGFSVADKCIRIRL